MLKNILEEIYKVVAYFSKSQSIMFYFKCFQYQALVTEHHSMLHGGEKQTRIQYNVMKI